MRQGLTKPWVAALATTLLLMVVQVALLLGDGADAGSESLPLSSPSGSEVAMGAGFAVFAFLVLWALYSLAARSRSRTARTRG